MVRLAKAAVGPAATGHHMSKRSDVFINATGGRAQHHRHPIGTIALFGGFDLRLYRRQRMPQQLIIAAAQTRRHSGRKRAQGLVYRAHGQVAPAHPCFGAAQLRRLRPQQGRHRSGQTIAHGRQHAGAA